MSRGDILDPEMSRRDICSNQKRVQGGIYGSIISGTFLDQECLPGTFSGRLGGGQDVSRPTRDIFETFETHFARSRVNTF